MKTLKTLSVAAVLACLTVAPVLAVNDIRAKDATGKTVYAVIDNSLQSGAATVYVPGTGFAALTSSNYATATVPVPETATGSGRYVVSFPSAIVASGRYPVAVYEQQGASPASTDPVIGAGAIDWGGTVVVADTDIYPKTALIATNGMDSPNSVTEQTQDAGTNSRVILALPNVAAGANGGLPTGNASGQVTVGGFASGALLALDQSIFAYTLGGVTYGDHVLNTSSTTWGSYTGSYPSTTQQTFAFGIGGTTYVTNTDTIGSSGTSAGKYVSKSVSLSNQ